MFRPFLRCRASWVSTRSGPGRFFLNQFLRSFPSVREYTRPAPPFLIIGQGQHLLYAVGTNSSNSLIGMGIRALYSYSELTAPDT